MTLAEFFTALEALARTFPVIAKGLKMLISGHPDAQRVRDVLEDEDGASARAEDGS